MAAKDIEAARAHVLITIRDRMTQGLKVAEQKLQNFGRYVATSAGVVTAGVGAGLAWPLKLAANMEQTQVAFEVMLGSGDKAKKLLKDLEQMGADTPFTFDQLKDAGQTLLNFNVSGNVLLPTLRAIGDVSAGNAERFSRLALAYGQTTAKGRLMGQEVNQMVEAGFNPLNEISRTTGRSMRELTDAMEKGEVSAAMLQNAFVTASGAGGKFFGMMDKQSKTLIGLLSTLFDNAAMVARVLGDTLLPAVSKTVAITIALTKGIATWIAQNRELAGAIATVAAGVFLASAAVFGLGIASMAASFFFGIMASGLAAITATIGFLFSPMGVLVGVLIALGVAAFQFRAGIVEAFGPVFDSILQLKDIFMGRSMRSPTRCSMVASRRPERSLGNR
jgi:tape measure domain-containing protein